MVQEILRSVGYFQSNHRNPEIANFRLVGRHVAKFDKFLVENLGMNLLETPENIATHCVAHGLALQGLGEAAISENFLKTKNFWKDFGKNNALISSLINFRLPNFIQSVIVIVTMLLLVGIIFADSSSTNELSNLVNASGGISRIEKPDTMNPYVLIKFETLADGSVTISPVFHPPFVDSGNNPLSHIMAKNMLGGK